MDPFTTIRHKFQIRLDCCRLACCFDQWAPIHDDLAVFGELEELIQRVRERSSFDIAVDQALRALCIQAATGAPGGNADDDATCLLLVLLLDPLLRRSRDRDVAGLLEVEDAQAELVAGVWEAIVSVSPNSSDISRLLINAGRRRMRGAAKRELDHRLRRLPLSDEASPIRQPTAADCPEEVIALARGDGVLNPLEAELIAGTRLEEAEPSDLARPLGLSDRAAFLRRDRAEARLLAWLAGTPPPPRRAAPARRDLLALFGSQAVSDLRDSGAQSSHVIEREEVKAHRGGSLAESFRRSDAPKPSRVSPRDGH
jgi:hypothetical protein